MKVKGINAHNLRAFRHIECSTCDEEIEEGERYIFHRSKEHDNVFRICLSCIVDFYDNIGKVELEKLKLKQTAKKI